MASLLMVLCALSIGYGGYGLARTGLERFDRTRNEARLRTARTTRVRRVPLASLLPVLEGWLSRWVDLPLLRDHHRSLGDWIRRSRKAEWTATQVMAYQALAAFGGGSFFYLLSDSGLLATLAFGLGAFYPFLWLREKALARERAVLIELPNALEVLSLCSEAGLSLEQGMDQYVRHAGTGPLATELGEILEQTRAGSSRKEAMGSAALRLSLTDFSLFTSSVIHAERFGTGVAGTLRRLAGTLRDKQSQRAEKAVQEMPVKLLFPLVLFIMPVTFLIIFGPILLQFMRP
ncbi:MAG TPA: type II secretion system F family protein [bacterium]|nr:type II secretion system F family protein [bacterium]